MGICEFPQCGERRRKEEDKVGAPKEHTTDAESKDVKTHDNQTYLATFLAIPFFNASMVNFPTYESSMGKVKLPKNKDTARYVESKYYYLLRIWAKCVLLPTN